jgi:hypothetical protein
MAYALALSSDRKVKFFIELSNQKKAEPVIVSEVKVEIK